VQLQKQLWKNGKLRIAVGKEWARNGRGGKEGGRGNRKLVEPALKGKTDEERGVIHSGKLGRWVEGAKAKRNAGRTDITGTGGGLGRGPPTNSFWRKRGPDQLTKEEGDQMGGGKNSGKTCGNLGQERMKAEGTRRRKGFKSGPTRPWIKKLSHKKAKEFIETPMGGISDRLTEKVSGEAGSDSIKQPEEKGTSSTLEETAWETSGRQIRGRGDAYWEKRRSFQSEGGGLGKNAASNEKLSEERGGARLKKRGAVEAAGNAGGKETAD